MAQGLANTHAHRADTDFSALAGWCREAGWPGDICAQAGRANTARHAFEMAPGGREKTALATVLAAAAMPHMRRFAGPGPALTLCVFDFDGALLVTKSSPPPARGG
jgi:cobalt-precorrin-5B (C1)-methyltransferase